MVLHGDELGRTQDGNNNGYAQDSAISWVHWDTSSTAKASTVGMRGANA
jgi:pullulanase/glycogen debranching enzyme